MRIREVVAGCSNGKSAGADSVLMRSLEDNMTFRKTIFWLHLISGIITGIIVLIMSVTGVALTYQKQMTAWADKRAYRVQASRGATPLAVSALLDSFVRARPGTRPMSVSLSSDPAMPATVTTGPNSTIYVDPYTGQILGDGSHGVRAFFKTMTDWHRWLALSGEKRGIGRAVTGACNAAFLFLAVSGLYLWWPSKWTRSILRAISWFRSGLKGKSRDFNWHHVFGFWCLVPLILIVISGVVISYPWASRLVYKLAGSQMSYQPGPPRMAGQRGGPNPGSGPAREQPALQLSGFDAAVASVQKMSGGWNTISISVPTVSDKTVAFSVDKGSGGQPKLRSTIIADKATGEIIRQEGFEQMDQGLRARMWMRFVHTGEYYGLTGQTVAGITSAAGVILVWTGFALTYRRFFVRARS